MLKNIIILFALCTLGGCIQVKTNIETVIQLGDRNAQCVWVYLCGLTTDFNSAEEISTRKTLHELGQKLNIGFLAVIPPARCLEYGDKLCWPHKTDKEVLETYNS